MIFRVKISSSHSGWLRYTPQRKGWWEDYYFDTRGYLDEYDYWIVLGDIDSRESAVCCADRVFLVIFEPPEMRKYTREFLDQFSMVFTWRDDIAHNNVIITPPPVPCMVSYHYIETGDTSKIHSLLKDYDQLKALESISKQKTISTVCSNKAMTPVQKKRIALTDYLGGALSEYDIDVYGQGRNYILDKWDALYPYKYHIAVENSVHPNYWTEKISDAFLGYSYPFYYGCPNLEEFFPPGSFSYIDLDDPEKTLWIIKRAIRDDYYRKYLGRLREARNLVLDTYNIFPYLIEQLRAMGSRAGSRKKVTLKPDRNSYLSATQKAANLILPYNSKRRDTVKSIRDKLVR
jgi:hypothetical protein